MTWFDVRQSTVDHAWLESCRSELAPLHDLLSGPGIDRGLVGPREADRLWDRHLLNCAAPVDPSLALVAEGATVVDIGSGAGLPGLVWALARPDLRMILIEPLQRRTAFLQEAVDDLGIAARVSVVRGRAQDVDPAQADVVTSRAVAGLGQLLGWCWPHVRPGGQVLALKGEKAAAEVSEARATIAALGAAETAVIRVVRDSGAGEAPRGGAAPPLATLVQARRRGES